MQYVEAIPLVSDSALGHSHGLRLRLIADFNLQTYLHESWRLAPCLCTVRVSSYLAVVTCMLRNRKNHQRYKYISKN